VTLAKKGLARYDVPVFRLGRLAVDKTRQGEVSAALSCCAPRIAASVWRMMSAASVC
jgi:hypothetical protein